MPRLGSLSALLSVKAIQEVRENGQVYWEALCPRCKALLRRRGPRPQATHRGAFKCRECGRRIVAVA